VLAELVPRLDGPYDVGALHLGVNDARSLDWDAAAFEAGLRAIAAALAGCCARLVLCTIPADLGRPPAAPKPQAASAIVRRVAAEHGAALAALDDLAGPPWLLPDAVHPTAVGQLEIADRAARVLGAPRLPSATVEVHRSRRARGRFAARRGVLLAGDLRRRAVERMRPPSL
jgi:lysophospholipase L1-like esterase